MMRMIRRAWQRSSLYGAPLAVKLIMLWIFLALCVPFGVVAYLLVTGSKMID